MIFTNLDILLIYTNLDNYNCITFQNITEWSKYELIFTRFYPSPSLYDEKAKTEQKYAKFWMKWPIMVKTPK